MKKTFFRLTFLLLSSFCCLPTAQSAQSVAEKWTPFKNIEQVEYCLSLPLGGYAQDFKQSDARAKHVFVHKAKKKSEITVAGLHRSDSKISAESYYKKYFEGTEENGLIVERHAFDAEARRFYSTGYWSNSIHESRFVEIVWLRDSEVIKLNVTFPLADAGLWKARLPELLKQTSICKPGA